MSLIAKDKGGTFKPVPAGTHVAVCTMVVDMGVQPSARFKPSPKVYIRWELPNEVTEYTTGDGQKKSGPMVIGKQYTLSLNEKANLRGDLESWRGKIFTKDELNGFNLTNILGKPCMIGVTHNQSGDKTYANISAVMGLSKGIAVPKATGELVAYSLDEHTDEMFAKLPPWLQEAISERVTNDVTKTVSNDKAEVDPAFDDEIPF